MSLENRLKRLKQQRKDDADARQKWNQKLGAKKAERNRTRDEALTRLMEVAEARVRPVLDILNRAYLEGTGRIDGECKMARKNGRDYEKFLKSDDPAVGRNDEPVVVLRLAWDNWSKGDSRVGAMGGCCLTVLMSKQECLVFAGAPDHLNSARVVARIWMHSLWLNARLNSALYACAKSDRCKWTRVWDLGR